MQYYHFSIEDDKIVKSVTFQTTTILGNVDLLASRTNKIPKEGENYKASWSGKRPIIYEKMEDQATNNVSLAGDYWLSVKGYD